MLGLLLFAVAVAVAVGVVVAAVVVESARRRPTTKIGVVAIPRHAHHGGHLAFEAFRNGLWRNEHDERRDHGH